MVTKDHYRTAKKEGRICKVCGWIISKKNWKMGFKLCAGCYSAYQGVKPKTGASHYADEPRDKTGEM